MDKRKNNGITLMVLVITIIVMLLLAAISINAAFGENGILTNAREAKIQYEEAALKEQIDFIMSDAAGMDFSLTEEEQSLIDNDENLTLEEKKIKKEELINEKYLTWVNNKFREQGIYDHAHIQDDIKGFALVYGIYSTKVDYVNKKYTVLDSLPTVVGDPNDWIIEVDDNTNEILWAIYKGKEKNVIMPNVVGNILINDIPNQTFMFNSHIETVQFSDGLTRIGDKAFSNCTSLKRIINWPTTLQYIGYDAFYNCTSLQMNIKFTDAMKEVGNRAFYGCSKINSNVTDIMSPNVKYGSGVFTNCTGISGDINIALSALVKPEDTKIPDNLFSGMSKLTGIAKINSNITEIGENSFYGCSGITGLDLSEVTSIVNGKTVLNIKKFSDNAFCNCSNMGGDISFNGTEYIGDYAFKKTGLNSVELEKSLQFVGEEAFNSCVKLTRAVINTGDVFTSKRQYNGSYGSWSVFSGDKLLKNLIFGNDCTMTFITGGMFGSCTSIESIDFPDTITVMKNSAFTGCSGLVHVDYPTSLTTLNWQIFRGCTQLVDFPDITGANQNLVTIGEDVFNGCSVIGKKEDGSKTDVITLLEGSKVTSVQSNALNGCVYLSGNYDNIIYNINNKSIDIGTNAFLNSSVIKAREYITVLADGTEVYNLSDSTGKVIKANEFANVNTFIKKDLRDGSKVELTEIVIPNGVEKIENYAFSSCNSITKIIMPSSLTSMGQYVFQQCTKLQEVKNYVLKVVPNFSFSSCGKLETVEFKDTIKSVGNGAFSSCTSYDDFEFKEGLETIGNSAFSYDPISGDIVMPSTLTSIGTTAFYSCKSLTGVDISKTQLTIISSNCYRYSTINKFIFNEIVKTIGSQAFESTQLKKVTVPDSVETLELHAFISCPELTEVLGCKNVSTMQRHIFANDKKLEKVEGCSKVSKIINNTYTNCTKLTSLDLNWDIIKSIGDEAFKGCTSLNKTIKLHHDCNVSSTAFLDCIANVEFY